MQENTMMTYCEVARLTGLKVGTLYAMVSTRRIPHIRLSGRLVRFPKVAIDRWLAERLVPIAAPEAVTRGATTHSTLLSTG